MTAEARRERVYGAPQGYSLDGYNRVFTADPGEHTVELAAGSIEGALPRELVGARYLLNGPARLKIGGHLMHPFDGNGFVRSFRVRDDGGVSYRSRFVETDAWRAERSAKAPVFRGIGTKIPGGMLANARASAAKNVANTTLYTWGDTLYAGWEGGAPHALDLETLRTEGKETFHGAIEGQAFLAHTRVDEERGVLAGLSPQMGRTTTLVFREFDAQRREVRKSTYAHDAGLFAHDFVMTKNWYVLGGNALSVNVQRFLAYKLGRATLMNVIEANAAAPGAVLLVPRDPSSGRAAVKAVLDGPFFVVHHANAYENDSGDVVLDTCATSELSFEHIFGYVSHDAPLDPRHTSHKPVTRLQRVVIDPRTGRAKRTVRSSHGFDFPRVHPAREGQRHRYVVGGSFSRAEYTGPFDALACADMDDPEKPVDRWHAGHDVYVGEPVFAPRPGADPSDELDGWVLAVTYEAGAMRSCLCVFDARDIAKGPVARVPAPALFPYGFHGAFVAA